VTVVWLSPGLPADRTELAAALPSDFLLAADSTDDASEISALPVGSLCVATVFETELVARLVSRPDGVRLLVIGPEGYQPPAVTIGERTPELMLSASSVGELATASTKATRRERLITAGAMVGALAIGGIVIASTEGASSASANTGVGGRGGGFPGGGNFGGNFGGLTGNGGGTQGQGSQGGIPGVTAANGQQLRTNGASTPSQTTGRP
jgi:hypothetical protein